jgi:hypothetical protein
MKIQVLHNSGGNICAIFAPAEGDNGGRKGGIMPSGSGTTVIEIDAPDVTLPEGVKLDDEVAARLAHLTEHFQVRSGRLVERSED